MSNWEERFDERFKLEPYEPRDRTTEQVRHIVNDDYAGEIVSDYVEEQEQGSREAFNSWLEDEMKPFIEEVIKETKIKTIEQVLKLPIKDAWLPDYKSSAMCIMVEEIEMLKDSIQEKHDELYK